MLRSVKNLIKSALEQLNRQRSAHKVKQQAEHITPQQLVEDLTALGIKPGDTLFLHSSLRSLGYVEGGPAAVIAALQQSVGPDGNILLPAYYLPGGTIDATCQLDDYQFDPRIHGTHMGRLPETFLKSTGVKRSLHPTHSVAAWGKDADYLTNGHHQAPSVFGEGSPWQRFLEMPQAKVLGLGISMGPVTFYHLLEDTLGEAYPLPVWDKEHQIPCIDANDKVWQVPVRSYNKALASQRIDHPSREDLRQYFRQEFLRAGLLHEGQVGAGTSWFIPAADFYRHLQHLAEQGITIYSQKLEGEHTR
ncbi:AAC(3) family N-acetyltransferase [Alkalimonas delamerensis]|uniref:Aminoglycoside N(3)-acetyltransferase n=1 Tax=Alkalimonas delamerensis TaxID=265981 RepID=A0ABT9GMD7_9GAMM|nr:AAC(3) family N-acetyltransferase [Alkalimonas delamerensis]MDP4528133.1 AAC(3) family N-acetyltransferase [Alkalimonas delamerensis]